MVVASLPEGEDKPIEYPHIFRSSGLVVLNKIGLAPPVVFDRDAFARFVREVKPDLPVLALSAARGDGVGGWLDWIHAARAALGTDRSRADATP